jgi:hypothetical protein
MATGFIDRFVETAADAMFAETDSKGCKDSRCDKKCHSASTRGGS